jgi:hypothetical protein
MDVYVDKGGRVWLVDFNVFADVTDGLLFSWGRDAALGGQVGGWVGGWGGVCGERGVECLVGLLVPCVCL